MDKLWTKEFLRTLGLRTAETFRVLDDPSNITDANIPDRCVVKPVEGTNSVGVMVLRREGSRFYDFMQRRTVTLEQIKAVQRESQAKHAAQFSIRSSTVMIEEAIIDEDGPDMVPLDYKVWTFNGRTVFIEQVDRNTTPKSAAWYVENFHPIQMEDVAVPNLKRFQRGRHRPPRCRDDILRAARVVSRALRTPFIRVDTYATPEGVTVGELTPSPGPVYYGGWRFEPWFDELLGIQWAKAVRELQGATSPEVA
jgi:hypothetical protein